MPYHYETQGSRVNARLVAENKDLATMFADGARGLWNLVIETNKVRGHDRVKIVVDASSVAKLYQAWLDEVLQRAEVEGLLLNEFRVATIQTLDDGHLLLTGEAFGETYNAAKHTLNRKPKTLKPRQVHCTVKADVTTCSCLV